VNDVQKLSLIPKIEEYFGKDLSGKKFGLWGLSFKPETDDVRESPSLYLMEELVKRGVTFKAHDPEALQTFQQAASKEVNANTEYVDQPKKALEKVDALIIATEWQEFRIPDLERFKKYMDPAVIFDGRNLYSLEDARKAGIRYISVGRPKVNVPEKVNA